MTRILFLLVASVVPAMAGLTVENPWVVALPPSAKDTAAFMTLVNTGTESLRVTGGRTTAARKVAPMISTRDGNVTGMKDVPFIEVPAGGKVVLRPGGDHLMLYGLRKPLKVGESITLEMTVEPGRRAVTVDAVVRKFEAK